MNNMWSQHVTTLTFQTNWKCTDGPRSHIHRSSQSAVKLGDGLLFDSTNLSTLSGQSVLLKCPKRNENKTCSTVPFQVDNKIGERPWPWGLVCLGRQPHLSIPPSCCYQRQDHAIAEWGWNGWHPVAKCLQPADEQVALGILHLRQFFRKHRKIKTYWN